MCSPAVLNVEECAPGSDKSACRYGARASGPALLGSAPPLLSSLRVAGLFFLNSKTRHPILCFGSGGRGGAGEALPGRAFDLPG